MVKTAAMSGLRGSNSSSSSSVLFSRAQTDHHQRRHNKTTTAIAAYTSSRFYNLRRSCHQGLMQGRTINSSSSICSCRYRRSWACRRRLTIGCHLGSTSRAGRLRPSLDGHCNMAVGRILPCDLITTDGHPTVLAAEVKRNNKGHLRLNRR